MSFLFQPKRIPYIAPIAGVLGFAVQLWLFSTGVDSKGLLLADHPAGALVFILTALTLAAIYLCLRPLNGTPVYKWMFPKSLPATIGYMAAAAGVVSTLFIRNAPGQQAMTAAFYVLTLAAAGCFVFLGICRYKGQVPSFIFHSCITIYLMFHLVYQYPTWNNATQLQEYFFPLLASVFLMLGTYYRATLDVDGKNRQQYVFFNYSAVFLCLVSLHKNTWPFYLAMAIWCATCDCSLISVKGKTTMYLPKDVQLCLNALTDAGYEAYAVGGCVRDSLLGLMPQDYDLCTSATPEQTAEVFAQYQLIRNGEKHGTIGVVINQQVYEITTFRTEKEYLDGRHPDSVEFVTSLKLDLARRDFTVNAIAYCPEKGYIDPWGGQNDLKNRVLRTVGEPALRFQEDALRILRGVRFAVRYDLTPEKDTKNAMLQLTPLMDRLAKERIFSELCKLLPFASAQDLLDFQPVITQAIEELGATVGFDQHSPHHAYDVYTHTAHTVAAAPEDLAVRLAALLHDIGKPAVFSLDENGRGHFYGHAEMGAKMADEILLRLRASNELREQVVFLIAHHMDALEPDKKLLRRRLGAIGFPALRQLINLQKADFSSKGTEEDTETDFAQIEALLAEIQEEDACLNTRDLAINGRDLLNMGVSPGPIIGACMQFLLELVQDDILPNSREALLQAAAEFIKDNQEAL
ncbi:MAG: CCA tRNA nucleotidyltransferase [Oscillospiraceae bacterium]|nr:CCA tRNA nucleotidyltransferase [Oscillospiraceae bacterium]